MTMIPPQSLSKHHQYGGYGGGSFSEDDGGLMSRLEGYDYCCSEAGGLVGSDLVAGPMAEDESRTESTTVNEAGSSSKEVVDERDQGWLQLGIGGGHMTTHDTRHHQIEQTSRRAGLMELDLLPGAGGGGGSSQQARSLPPAFHVPEFRPPRPISNIPSGASYGRSLFLQHPGSSSTFPHHQDFNWAFRPIPRNIMVASSSTSSSSSSLMASGSSLMASGSYFTRPFQLHPGVDVARPSLDFRIIDPPRRPHSGIWFMLQASQNQAKEPFLPQIPKSYLRIKDGRMTVRLLMKYLVNKLGLDNESEIEITCRGQQLQPFLTLQHVRDNIWSPRDALTLLPDSSTSNHIMVLHYARSTTSS